MSPERNDDTERTIQIHAEALLRAAEHEEPEGQRATLVVLAGWEIGREIELPRSEFVLGRCLTLPSPVPSASVSRRHARITCAEKDGQVVFRVEDLDSMNGTQVNNRRVKSTLLHDGDKVQIGDVVFRFSLHDAMESEFHKEVHRRIHYDGLTGLLKLEAFMHQVQNEVQRLERAVGARFTVAMTDLDGLKRVNDTHGHLIGRRVIQEMGTVIRGVLGDRGCGGLYGGDETVLLFHNMAIAEAEAIAEEIRAAIEGQVFEADGSVFHVTISQGLAEWPTHGRSVERLVAAADHALYAAKAAGRNCTRIAEAEP